MRKRGKRVPRAAWPAELQVPYVKGLYLGGCVERGQGSSFRASAHAHTQGAFEGWICIRGEYHVAANRDENSRHLLFHERAHIATGEGHTDEWRRELLRIAGYLKLGECKMKRVPPTMLRRHEDGYDVFAYHDNEHHPSCPCLPVFRSKAYRFLNKTFAIDTSNPYNPVNR